MKKAYWERRAFRAYCTNCGGVCHATEEFCNHCGAYIIGKKPNQEFEYPTVRGCANCMHDDANHPHTCDICMSLDCDCDFEMFEPRIPETDEEWIPMSQQVPNENGLYQVTIRRLSDNHVWSQELVKDECVWYWYWDSNYKKSVDMDLFTIEAYCLPKKAYQK